MNNNIKYIISFVNKKCGKTLCYLLTDNYRDNNKFTKLKQEAKKYNDDSYRTKFIGRTILETYNDLLTATERYLYFDNIKKSNIKMVISEYNVIQEERKAKLRKLL